MKKRPLCIICLLFLIIQTLRISLSGAQVYKPSASEQTAAEQDSVTVKGTVTDIQNKELVTAVCLEDCLISMISGDFNEKKLLVYIRPDSEIRIGNKVKVTGEAALFDKARNPGNFDQSSYYARQDIYMLVWADEVEHLSADTDEVRQFLMEVRSAWNEMLVRYLGEYYGGTMSAVLLGEKSGLDAEMKKLYQKNGIGHLLAISGVQTLFLAYMWL